MLKTDAVISVVDDDESVRNSLKRLLRSMGFEVRAFPSAFEFLRQGPLHDHGCVIVDVRMPEMNGLDLQKRLTGSGVSLPVILITAYEDPGVRAQAIQAGAVAFLQKPFSDPSLMDAINLALERSSQQISGRSETLRGEEASVPISGLKQ
jgi:FixJ family two-component response regulator